jgi:MFS transporter, FHS family, glucose/mannose:H+ symporter
MNAQNLRISVSLFLNYFVFAILLNSVGTVILQVQNNYGVTKLAASMLEPFKDMSIALASFLVASYFTRIGYKRAMLIALALVTVACLLMPNIGGFAMTKLLFATVGASFALLKISVYSTIGIIAKDKQEHASLMNFIESFFMVGVLTGPFIFTAFVDDVHPESTAWLNAYYILASISAAAFLLLWGTPLDESSVKAAPGKPLVQDFKEMYHLVVKKLVLVFVASAFFYVLIEQSIMSWLPTYNNKVLMLPTSLSIQMGSILAGSIALGRFLAGLVLRKKSWYPVLTACLAAAAALVLVAIPLAKGVDGASAKSWADAPLAAFVFPLIGLFLAPIYPAINSAILSAVPARMHGPMTGLIVIFSALGGSFGSLLTAFIFDHYGGQKAFYFSLLPISVLAFSLFVFNKLQKRQLAGG